MNLRREIEALRRRVGSDHCPACFDPDEPIKVTFIPPGEEREDKEPCPVCGETPIVINWSNR